VTAEHDFEPVPGLPADLPEGEHVLWRGSPGWWPLARQALWARAVAIYFAILVAWRVVDGLAAGKALPEIALGAGWIAAVGIIGVALLTGLAWFQARATIYTITDKRVVLRFGVALPLTVNLPFKMIEGADLKTHGDGTGDISLRLMPPEKVSYVLLWPHVRPWAFSAPEPTIRAVSEPEAVAAVLADALVAAAESEGDGATVSVAERGSDAPTRIRTADLVAAH
jgi:hypothetical protein